ncbi:GRAM domain-containing protein 4-like [Ylistrum balloti]|uniref:GRAM domain-containing protein 4-like n=1 Tax=Ylistrum balloti TaxID=509963 RepID=UPI00290584B7|nr:GRAM domain-containing protein 4-like [Ylistrum balloti]
MSANGKVKKPGLAGSSGDGEPDLAVFESQLITLQEQLVAVMIENQELQSKLREYDDTTSMQKLRLEIDIERKRYRELENRYSSLVTKSARDHQIYRQRTGSGTENISRPALEIAEDASKVAEKEEIENFNQRRQKFLPGAVDRMWTRLVRFSYETMDDFTEDMPGGKEEEQSDGDPLTVKTLKENINRFGIALKPYISTVKGVNNLLTWKSPSYTVLVFLIYMYTVWKGWFLPVVVIMLLARLFITYLQHHGFKIEFTYFDPGTESEKPEESLGISDKFNLVLQVARKVQNGLKGAADSLEKIKSLLTWRHQATRQLFFGLTFVFIMSCFVPSMHLLRLGGLMFGVKVFIINYFYNKYPRLQRKYDSAHKTWMSLPTDVEYQQECMKTELNKYVFVETREELDECSTEVISNQDKQFCELFSLPPAESPLSGWKGGRRCTLINKEKAFAAGFKNGKIYLTKSFVCFERKTSPSPKNIVIPLTDIVKFQKCKPYGLLPGNGMALEIVVTGNKTFVFGGILNRDEAYDHIVEIGLENMLPWATGETLSVQQEDIGASSTTLRKRNSGQKFRNFSLASEYNDSD